MPGEVKWTLEVLGPALEGKRKRMVAAMAAHWTRAAQDRLSVSAGGNSKRARAIRRTRGNVTRGPLGKVRERFLAKPARFEKRMKSSRKYADMLATDGDTTMSSVDRAAYGPRQAARAATDVYEKFRHSKPGESPRKITGFLQRNVVWRFATSEGVLVARAGLFVNALYGYFLEVGFRTRFKAAPGRRGVSRVLPRPWMVRTLRAEMPAFRQIVASSGGSF